MVAITGTHDLHKEQTVVVGSLEQAGSPVNIGDANYAFLPEDSGKPHLVANVSADRTFTLPAARAGLDYTLIATVGAADGHDWTINTAVSTSLFKGGVLMVDTDAGPATVAAVVADQSNDDSLQVNLPQGGTWLRLVCDGTNWTVSGTVLSTAAAVFS